MVNYNYREEEQIIEAKFYGKIGLIDCISHVYNLNKMFGSWERKVILEDYSFAEIVCDIDDLKFYARCIFDLYSKYKITAIAWLCNSPLSSAKLYIISKLLTQKNQAKLFSTKPAALVWLHFQKERKIYLESYYDKRNLEFSN